MVVRTDTGQVLDARQAVLSIINANHSDRCLTCHRRVHCQPGDICLRDDTVTHRCLTCAKNYRCELQTTNEMLQMANYEPWLGEERTYYESEQPEADRANPFLEFDPQMCIICTRCVRACDEIRHTGAITLAGRGFATRIAFGAGGADPRVELRLLRRLHRRLPDRDAAREAEQVDRQDRRVGLDDLQRLQRRLHAQHGRPQRQGRHGQARPPQPRERRPDLRARPLPLRRDQAARAPDPPPRPRGRRRTMPTTFDVAIDTAATSLPTSSSSTARRASASSSRPGRRTKRPTLVQKLARGLIGTENVDSTAGPLEPRRQLRPHRRLRHRQAARPTSKTRHRQDRSSSSPTTSSPATTSPPCGSRTRSSATAPASSSSAPATARSATSSRRRPPARSCRRRSGCTPPTPTGVWLRPTPGGELATARCARRTRSAAAATANAPGIDADSLRNAANILKNTGEGKLAVIFAPSPAQPSLAHEGCEGRRQPRHRRARAPSAAASLHVLPATGNANGIADMGATPGNGGKTVTEMLAGGVRALVIAGDNPSCTCPTRTRPSPPSRTSTPSIVIDSLPTDTAKLANVVFADLPAYGKDGTYTTADRRIVAPDARRDAPPATRPTPSQCSMPSATALAAKLGKQLSLSGQRRRQP